MRYTQFHHWIASWLSVFDGLVSIITLAYIRPSLEIDYYIKRIKLPHD
jgi:hypothetical protein